MHCACSDEFFYRFWFHLSYETPTKEVFCHISSFQTVINAYDESFVGFVIVYAPINEVDKQNLTIFSYKKNSHNPFFEIKFQSRYLMKDW